MLPRAARVHRSAEFTEVVRGGARGSRPLLTVHLLTATPGDGPAPAGPARAGLVVGKGVGGSVVRSTVARRLRHQLAPRLEQLPDGCRVVVRAAPGAGAATSAALGADLDLALERALGRARRRTPAPAPEPIADPAPGRGAR